MPGVSSCQVPDPEGKFATVYDSWVAQNEAKNGVGSGPQVGGRKGFTETSTNRYLRAIVDGRSDKDTIFCRVS